MTARIPPMLPLLLSFLLLVSLAVGKEAPSSTDDVPKKHRGVALAERQIDWLRSKKGGFYSPKITIRPLFESDSDTVPLGLFASGEGFQKGETVMVVPRQWLLTTGSEFSEDMCHTAENLVRQRKLQDESDYEPYVSYVFSKERITLPSTFSSRGKSLLLLIRGQQLPPDDLTKVSFAQHCTHSMSLDQEEDKEMLEFAYLTVVSRAWSDKLVPVFDMINHHSGRYANVDSTSILTGTDDITVHALRDIPPGEQLFLSYMDCIDEQGYELDYVLPQMLRDFGFVDEYPQRWTFPTPTTSKNPYVSTPKPSNDEEEDEEEEDDDSLVFDIDFVNEEADALFKAGKLKSPPEMKLTWRTGEPTVEQIQVLAQELQRMEKLKSHVIKTANLLKDPYERSVTLDYYNSLTIALTFATANKTCTLPEDYSLEEGQVCLSGFANVEEEEEIIDTMTLEDDQEDDTEPEHKPTYHGNNPDDWMACDEFWKIEDDYEHVEEFYSHYQGLDIYYGKAEDDSCLYLDGYLHTCASSRPHYHEVFVHYPARFLDKVERVLFIGGGDSMVLHEVLKYQDLELVVGLELDQRVTRTTFNTFGTQPHFDNDKVHWYFGDAAKSMLALPSNYYGSFDLVIVDILTEVAESLAVNYELKVMEAAMLLMKPGGIIVKNEDQGYVPGTNKDYTKYSVDLIYHDVPLYCLQIFVVGSNTVDFLTAQPKDHNVETIYLKGVDEFQSQFDSWYNFGGDGTRKCDQDEAAEEQFESDYTVGVMMILEAESIAVSLDTAETLKPVIVEALNTAGITGVDAVDFAFTADDGVTGFSLTIFAQEGYLVARCNPELRYCAFDIQLYGPSVLKLEVVKASLIAALQSAQNSSYRFVTGGMSGLNNEGNGVGPPSAKELCNTGVHGTTSTRTEVRKEKRPEDFDTPKASGLHAYDLISPLSQWQSQKPTGAQVLVQLDLPVFWAGEKVFVENRGAWVPGTVTNLQDDYRYDVKLDGRPKILKDVEESEMMRDAEQFDMTLVTRFLAEAMDVLLEANGHSLEPGSFAYKQVSDGNGVGIVVATHWTGGNIVATWDGRNVVSINLYLASIKNHQDIVNIYGNLDERLVLMSLDIFPRGGGNIVSFKEDLLKQPVWATEVEAVSS
ncbi:Spermidine synthase 1 [Seminavis robusta]|uniref:Spermidine synthase 1 n=1 Tax=Seminavis robusta TaxID=568900 RepID=A0A9N8HC08_9STRA|nr:Spermidine synthase 1 [Seminavis robusta]|eukprot:Sro300_g111590.1 Spermidine synthase 1 (1134) ;mRNA; f:4103-7594